MDSLQVFFGEPEIRRHYIIYLLYSGFTQLTSGQSRPYRLYSEAPVRLYSEASGIVEDVIYGWVVSI